MKILNERPTEMSFEDYKEHLKRQKIYIKMKQKKSLPNQELVNKIQDFRDRMINLSTKQSK